MSDSGHDVMISNIYVVIQMTKMYLSDMLGLHPQFLVHRSLRISGAIRTLGASFIMFGLLFSVTENALER